VVPEVLGIPFLFSAPPQMAFFDCGGVRLLVGVEPQGAEPHVVIARQRTSSGWPSSWTRMAIISRS